MDILSILREHDSGPDIWRMPEVENVDGIAVFKRPAVSGTTTTLLMVAAEYAKAGRKTMFVGYEENLEALQRKADIGGVGNAIHHPNLTIIPGGHDPAHPWPVNDGHEVIIFDTARARWRALASMVMGVKEMRDLGALVICGWQLPRSESK